MTISQRTFRLSGITDSAINTPTPRTLSGTRRRVRLPGGSRLVEAAQDMTTSYTCPKPPTTSLASWQPHPRVGLCPLTVRFRLGLPVSNAVQRTRNRVAGTYPVQPGTLMGGENGENGTYALPFRSETTGGSDGLDQLSGSSYL